MLSSIFVSGQVGEFDKTRKEVRYVNVQRVIPTTEGGKYQVDSFPVIIKYSGSPLLAAKTGHMIVIKGRLETLKDFGLVIVEELCEIYSAVKTNKN